MDGRRFNTVMLALIVIFLMNGQRRGKKSAFLGLVEAARLRD